MSKLKAVTAAVCDQLTDDGHPEPFGDGTLASLGYNEERMDVLLSRVRERLAQSDPAFAFDRSKLGVDAALADTVDGLISDVDDAPA